MEELIQVSLQEFTHSALQLPTQLVLQEVLHEVLQSPVHPLLQEFDPQPVKVPIYLIFLYPFLFASPEEQFLLPQVSTLQLLT